MTTAKSILNIIPLAQSTALAKKAAEPKEDLKDIVGDFGEIVIGTKLTGITANIIGSI